MPSNQHTAAALLRAHNLGLRYQQRWVFRGVSLELARGEVVALVGRSGCGKSSLLQCIAGLLAIDAGELWLGNTQPAKPGYAAYLPQRHSLLDCATLVDNLALPLRLRGLSKKAARAEAMPLLARFGLQGFAHCYPCQLSGGMAQRAALARAYISHSPIVLLDEPLGALDAITRREMQQWLANALSQLGTSALLVTHDVDEALLLGHKVAVMHGTPAGVSWIDWQGTPDGKLTGKAANQARRAVHKLLELAG